MSKTYTHDHENAFRNPHPLSHDALSAVGIALEAGARGDGPLVRSKEIDHDPPTDSLLPIMGSKLSPSPELHGAGGGALDVDYADGSTRTFDVDSDGSIEPRRYAYAFAAVIHTDEPITTDDRTDTLLAFIGDTFLNCQDDDAEIVYASTPTPIPYTPGDYGEQPAGFNTRDERTTR